MSYYIEKFVPLRYERYALDQIDLSRVLGRQMRYASCGKAALYHCLLSLGLKRGDKVLVPNYICSSVLVPIQKIGLIPIFYDINEYDLNANLDSIEGMIGSDTAIKAVVVASMYGTPADLESIEQFCKDNNILLIDDAAQSFGAKINGRFLGTFGNAGFFSFSPGKATPGHLGAFYWTSNENYKVTLKNHYLYHRVAYWSYYFDRYQIYKYQKWRVFRKFIGIVESMVKKQTDYWDDRLNNFEKPILGGILKANFSQSFRTEYSRKFYDLFTINECFRVITRGEENTNNHKLVILCNSREIAASLIIRFEDRGICTISGYSLLDHDAATPLANSIEQRVIEIPLENDPVKFEYIVNALQDYIDNRSNY